MARAPQLDRLLQRALGWALVVLFGLAPFSPLLALASEPECQMACCERRHAAHSCPLHQASEPGATPIHFEASNTCPANCSCAGVAPSAAGLVLIPAHAAIRNPNARSVQTRSSNSPTVRCAFDPALYQRPPPLPV